MSPVRSPQPCSHPTNRLPGKYSARSPRFKIGDAVMVNEQAPEEFQNRRGMIAGLDPGGGMARVNFDDGLRPATGYLRSRWLDL